MLAVLKSINSPHYVPRRCISSIDLRKSFVNYFEDYDHMNIPSSSVIPSEDPSLLFTNAGMNQFKSIFLGSTENRWSYVERAVNYQKCIRAGGKHNDLDDVGFDLHHQTFFEMLGNWSFNGSYGKDTACRFAWDYLVNELSIDPKRLYVSYFGGNSEIPADLKCRDIWKSIGVPDSHIIPFDKENFWEMGATGPCGPCTEIHYDRLNRENVSSLVNVDDSVVELWNLVFISYNRNAEGPLSSLPNLHVDTGMGLERLLSVLQDVPSNFDTDLFVSVIKELEKVSPYRYGGKVGGEFGVDAAFRIVADHLRAVTFAISDGAAPSAKHAGFVVRKMMRRIFWQSQNLLKIERGFCNDVIPIIMSTMGSAYPGLLNSLPDVQRSISQEEEQFWRIIDKGKKHFDDFLLKTPEGNAFSGEHAFCLHDTHGFSIDVTEQLAKDRGIKIDMSTFEKLKDEAKMVSKASSGTTLSNIRASDYPTHSSSAKYEYCLSDGRYDFPSIETIVLDVGTNSQQDADSHLILENCQFFASEGGQKADHGRIIITENTVFEVTTVEKINGITVLLGKYKGDIQPGMVVKQQIDQKRRCSLMRAHTATHLLNWALRKVGAGNGQRGSSVDEDSLRFDYAVGEDVQNKIAEVENLIRSVITQGAEVVSHEIPLPDAKRIPSLQSEFIEGKEYPPIVRVKAVGSSSLDNSFAIECCSGTHVLNTRSIGDFCIMSDKSTGKGVRRIRALTGHKAQEALDSADRLALLAQTSSKEFKRSKLWNEIPLVSSMLLKKARSI